MNKLKELEKRIETLEQRDADSDMIVCMPEGGIIEHRPWRKTVM